MPLCDECLKHWAREHDRLTDSFRAVILNDTDLPVGAVRDAYFTAFHNGGHVKNDDWDAVDAADPQPHSSFQRWLDSQNEE